MEIYFVHIYKSFIIDGEVYYYFNEVELGTPADDSGRMTILTGRHVGHTLPFFTDDPKDNYYCCDSFPIEDYIEDNAAQNIDLNIILDMYRSDCLLDSKSFRFYKDGDEYIKDYDINPQVNELIYKKVKENPKGNNIALMPIHVYYEELLKSIKGQDIPAKRLLTAIYHHQKLINNPSLTKEQIKLAKENIFVVGPTGEGKTEMINIISRLLSNIPFVIEDSTRYSQVGFKGEDIDDALRDLVTRCDDDISRAEKGIIVFDEIDKKSDKKSTSEDNISTTGVQYSLLSLLQGTVVNFDAKANGISERKQIDTSTIQFVIMGAFVEAMNKKSKALGFGQSEVTKVLKYTDLQAKDLIQMGIVDELVGRSPIIIGLNRLEVADYEKIIKYSNISDLLLKQTEFKSYNVELTFDDAFVHALAVAAKKRNIGIRGIKSVLSEVLSDATYEMFDGDAREIILNGDTLETGKTLIRK